MQPCPRQRNEATMQVQLNHQSHWREDGTCSYCGSMSPETFFAKIAEGAELGPTDKNYKVYVGSSSKFYFQHLNEDEQQRFVDLYNAREMKIGFPGHFYRLPFFMVLK